MSVTPEWMDRWVEAFCADPDKAAAERVLYRAAVEAGAPLDELFFEGGAFCAEEGEAPE
jgi:hypothetical protein